MRTIPLREFQREGARAFGAAPYGEPCLLAGRDREFVLLPVTPQNRSAVLDLAEGLAAVLALRQDQRLAVEAGLDLLTMDEIEDEIREGRKCLKCRETPA